MMAGYLVVGLAGGLGRAWFVEGWGKRGKEG